MSWSALMAVSRDHGMDRPSSALRISFSLVDIFTEESYPQASLEAACRLCLQTPRMPRSKTGVYAAGMAKLSLDSISMCGFWLCSLSTENAHVNGSCVRAQSVQRGNAVSARAYSERVHRLKVIMSMARVSLGSSICELSGRNRSRPLRPETASGSTLRTSPIAARAKTEYPWPGDYPHSHSPSAAPLVDPLTTIRSTEMSSSLRGLL